MKRVTSIGGIFFKCKDPARVREWYERHLGLVTNEYGTSFEWRKVDSPEESGFTVWSPFPDGTEYFDPSEKDFMINYRVENIEDLVNVLKEEGVEVLDEIEGDEYGKFVHILDPEGNKIELWEPVDEVFDRIAKNRTK